MLKIIKDFLNGLVLGITQTVPGVSGGTIAIIMGFYFDLIKAINHFTEDIRKNFRFLFPLALGTAAGLLLFSSIINYFLANYSFPMMLFFIGLMIGTIPQIYSKVKEKGQRIKFTDVVMMIIPFVVVLAMSGLKREPVPTSSEAISNIGFPYMVFIFFAGIIAAAILVIPGVSGSFALLLLGLYPLVIHSVSSIRLLLIDITNITLLQNICKVLVPLGIGIVIGGLLMARLIEKLLFKYEKIVYTVILGLILGSVCVLFMDPIVYKSGISAFIIAAGVLTFSLGCVLSFKLGKNRT
jgi:putative membrane protein